LESRNRRSSRRSKFCRQAAINVARFYRGCRDRLRLLAGFVGRSILSAVRTGCLPFSAAAHCKRLRIVMSGLWRRAGQSIIQDFTRSAAEPARARKTWRRMRQ
jgi:hypothetical protein